MLSSSLTKEGYSETKHSFKVLDEKEAKCLEDGYSVLKCSVCGTVVNTTITATGHNFDVLVESAPATCTENGYELYKCTDCEECFLRNIFSEGHEYDSNGVCIVCGARDPESVIEKPELVSSKGNYLKAKTYTDLELKNAPGDGYKYKFIVYNATSKQWYKLQDFSDATAFRWYTGPAGTKNLYVDIKNKTDEADITRVALTDVNVTEIGLKVTSFESTEGRELSVGIHTTLKASAENGMEPYEYKFIVHNEDNGQWYKICDFKTDDNCDWYTGPVGNKTLYVDIKDADGIVVRKGLGVTIR